MNEDLRDIDRILASLGVPDDLAEVGLVGEAQPDRAALERIKSRTLDLVKGEQEQGHAAAQLSKAQVSQKKRIARLQKIRLAAAAAVVLLALVGIIGPQRVAAGVNWMLTYVPGFGVKAQDNFYLAASEPISFAKDGLRIEVRGLMADKDWTSVNLFVDNKLGFNQETVKQQVYLVDEKGKRYSFETGHWYGPGKWTDYWLGFEPLAQDTRKVTMVLGSDLRIDIPVVPATGLAPLKQFGPAVTSNRVTIAAQVSTLPTSEKILQSTGAKHTAVTILVEGERNGRYSLEKPLMVLPQGEFPLSGEGGTGDGELNYLSGPVLDQGVNTVKIKVPSMELRQEVKGKVTLPLPEKGQALDLNLPVKLGEWSFKFTRIELSEGGNVRLYTEVNPEGSIYLTRWSMLELNGKPLSWSSEFDPDTDCTKYMDFKLPEGARKLKLEIGQAELKVLGPWELEVPVKR